MSFILEPGTIPHIQHIYQPTEKDWDIGSGWAITLLQNLDQSNNVGYTNNPYAFRATYKIDDRISLKVAKIAGDYYVGYKGLNSPFLDTPEQIDFLYQDKEYVAKPLKMLLKYAKDIIPTNENNIEVQVGILWCADDTSNNAPYEVIPNVVTYKFINSLSTYKLIISIVSATRFDPNGNLFFESNLKQFCRLSVNVLALNPEIPFKRAGEIQWESNRALELADSIRNRMIEKQYFDTIKGYEPLMCKFFNHLNRSRGDNGDTWFTQFLDWFETVHTEQVVSKLKLQKNKDAKREALAEQYAFIEDNWQAFDPAFDLCSLLRYAALEILDETLKIENKQFTQSKINEGVVLSYFIPSNPPWQQQVIFKVVPPEFSHANFEKNKDLYK